MAIFPEPNVNGLMQSASNSEPIRLVDEFGKPIDENSGFLLGHQRTFAAIWASVNQTYYWKYDEAIKHSEENALAMRRDTFILGCLQERYLQLAELPFHLEGEDQKSKIQKAVVDDLTKVVSATNRWTQFLYQLCEALWYGRYANQVRWEVIPVGGAHRLAIVDHRPVNGDKIQFNYDGTPQVMIHHSAANDLIQTGQCTKDDIVYGGRAPMLKLTDKKWRQRFIIHKHICNDADYFDGEMAGGVHGVGLRSMIYWGHWLRDEMLGWAINHLKKVGVGGILVFYYEEGNSQSQRAAESAAQDAGERYAIAMPRPRGAAKDTAHAELLSFNNSGVAALTSIIQDYFERHIERLIIGQTLSSKAEGTGLGSGVANFQADTKYRILKFDAANLGDSLTSEMILPMQTWNAPKANFRIKLVFDCPDPQAEQKLQAAGVVFQMGGKIKEDELLSAAGFSAVEEDDEALDMLTLTEKQGEIQMGQQMQMAQAQMGMQMQMQQQQAQMQMEMQGQQMQQQAAMGMGGDPSAMGGAGGGAGGEMGQMPEMGLDPNQMGAMGGEGGAEPGAMGDMGGSANLQTPAMEPAPEQAAPPQEEAPAPQAVPQEPEQGPVQEPMPTQDEVLAAILDTIPDDDGEQEGEPTQRIVGEENIPLDVRGEEPLSGEEQGLLEPMPDPGPEVEALTRPMEIWPEDDQVVDGVHSANNPNAPPMDARGYQAVAYESAHAPAGGVTIAGHEFAGGQFIPKAVMAKATKEERAAVSGGGSKAQPPKPTPAPSPAQVTAPQSPVERGPQTQVQPVSQDMRGMDEGAEDDFESAMVTEGEWDNVINVAVHGHGKFKPLKPEWYEPVLKAAGQYAKMSPHDFVRAAGRAYEKSRSVTRVQQDIVNAEACRLITAYRGQRMRTLHSTQEKKGTPKAFHDTIRYAQKKGLDTALNMRKAASQVNNNIVKAGMKDVSRPAVGLDRETLTKRSAALEDQLSVQTQNMDPAQAEFHRERVLELEGQRLRTKEHIHNVAVSVAGDALIHLLRLGIGYMGTKLITTRGGPKPNVPYPMQGEEIPTMYFQGEELPEVYFDARGRMIPIEYQEQETEDAQQMIALWIRDRVKNRIRRQKVEINEVDLEKFATESAMVLAPSIFAALNAYKSPANLQGDPKNRMPSDVTDVGHREDDGTDGNFTGGQSYQATTYEAAHAPKGGVTVAGKSFTGGQFIPGEVMAKATPQEKEKVRGVATKKNHKESTPQGPDVAVRQKVSGMIADAIRKSGAKNADAVSKSLLSMVSKMDKSMILRIDRNLKLVRVHSGLNQVRKSYQRIEPGYNDDLAGFYSTEDGAVEFQMGKGNAHVESIADQIAAHELAHAIDGPGWPLSGSRLWRYASERELLPELTSSNRLPLTYQATQSTTEAWAEFGRLMMMKPNKAKAKFPLCYKAFLLLCEQPERADD